MTGQTGPLKYRKALYSQGLSSSFCKNRIKNRCCETYRKQTLGNTYIAVDKYIEYFRCVTFLIINISKYNFN